MKVTVFIDISREVEVDVTADDIRLILDEPDALENVHIFHGNLSNIYVFLKGIPDRLLKNMDKEVKQLVLGKIREQLKRWE